MEENAFKSIWLLFILSLSHTHIYFEWGESLGHSSDFEESSKFGLPRTIMASFALCFMKVIKIFAIFLNDILFRHQLINYDDMPNDLSVFCGEILFYWNFNEFDKYLA